MSWGEGGGGGGIGLNEHVLGGIIEFVPGGGGGLILLVSGARWSRRGH